MTNVLLSSFTLDEFKAVIREVLQEETSHTEKKSQDTLVYGLDGLCDLLKISRPTAQRYKNSGKIPYSQTGRKIVFNAEEVLTAIQKKGGIAR